MTRKAKKGRPKGSRNERTIVREVARMQTTISEAGKEERVAIAEVMVRLLERRTMTGDVAADRLLAKLRQRVAPEDEGNKPAFLLVPEPLDAAEWIRRAEIRNGFIEPPLMPPAPPGTIPGPQPPSRPSGSGRPPGSPPPDKPPPPSLRGRLIR